MNRALRSQFNQDVENFRRSLLYHARISDWESFKARAGRLFDYVESIESSELERRFFNNFNMILTALLVVVVALFQVDFAVTPELLRFKNGMVLTAFLASSFELYFYVNYRTYVKVRAAYYAKRREKFIRSIEQDFRSYVVETPRLRPA